MPKRNEYAAHFSKDRINDRWLISVSMQSGIYPAPGAALRVSKRAGGDTYLTIGEEVESRRAPTHRTYEKGTMVRLGKYEGKFLKSRVFYNPSQRGSLRGKALDLIIHAPDRTLHIDDYLFEGGRTRELGYHLDRFRVSLLDREDEEDREERKPLDEKGEEIREEAEASPAREEEETPKEPEPEIERPDFEAQEGEHLPAVFRRMFELASVGQNILLVGPSGSGKTFLSGKLAEKLGRDFAAQSCSAGMSESQLAGWLLPIGESGRFAYVPSAFVRMYEEGGVFLFDEMDAADENTLIFINAALAGDHFYLPQRFDNPRVSRHPDFVAVAAANTFGNGESAIYSGRTQLDGATLDRFRAGVIEVDYDLKVERKLVDPEILAWGKRVRKAIERNSLDRIMSTRVLIDFTLQKRTLGYRLADMKGSYFADWTEDERRMAD